MDPQAYQYDQGNGVDAGQQEPEEQQYAQEEEYVQEEQQYEEEYVEEQQIESYQDYAYEEPADTYYVEDSSYDYGGGGYDYGCEW